GGTQTGDRALRVDPGRRPFDPTLRPPQGRGRQRRREVRLPAAALFAVPAALRPAFLVSASPPGLAGLLDVRFVVLVAALAGAVFAGRSVRSATVPLAAALRSDSIAFSAETFRGYDEPIARIRPWLLSTQLNSPGFDELISNFAAMVLSSCRRVNEC